MKNNKCKFQLFITKGIWKGAFQCAAMPDGWAYSWSSNPQSVLCPCWDCNKYIEGTPTRIDHWLKSKEFWNLSGQIILKEDWDYWASDK